MPPELILRTSGPIGRQQKWYKPCDWGGDLGNCGDRDAACGWGSGWKVMLGMAR